ncbi:MAG TPA: hypothetical protein P5107_00545 [Thermotogota bacterium]|nr:hypothetical protein [Thermotogota bacterium]HRW33527.1 hypothetical protein [Thermotogota bacterium]
MKKTVMLMALLVTATVIFSAIMATTDDGRRVVLNSNGTWEWLNQPQPGPIPPTQLLYDITGSWSISFTVGIFDESYPVEIFLENGSYVLLWHGTFSDEKYPITIVNNREIKFQGKSFHNGIVSFDAVISDANSMQGVASSSGTFAKTGSFKAVRK